MWGDCDTVGEFESVDMYMCMNTRMLCDSVCGGEAFDGGGDGELGISESGISEMVDSSVK